MRRTVDDRDRRELYGKGFLKKKKNNNKNLNVQISVEKYKRWRKTTGFVFSRSEFLGNARKEKERLQVSLVQFLAVSYRGDLFFDVRDKHPRNSENPGILTPRTCARFKSRNSTVYKRTGTSLVVYIRTTLENKVR